MYYFFKPKMVYWHKNVISAHYLNREPGKLEPVWWYGKPLLPTPLEFEFCIPGKAPVLDNYFPGLLDWDNLVGACSACNSAKQAQSLLIYLLRILAGGSIVQERRIT